MSILGSVARYFNDRSKPKFGNIGLEDLPEYKKSKYEDKSSEQLYRTYSRRAEGKDVGFDEGDMSVMKGQAIDESARVGNELERRGMAGRRSTGGVTTGGTNRIRDKAILATQLARTQSLRDIAIRNSVLKRQETWQGIRGLHDFLNTERRHALSLWEGNMRRVTGNNQNKLTQKQYDYQDALIPYEARSNLIEGVDDSIDQVMAMYAGGAGGGMSIPSGGGAKSMSNYRGTGYYQPLNYSGIDYRKYGY